MTTREEFLSERIARETEKVRMFSGRRHFAGIALRALLEDAYTDDLGESELNRSYIVRTAFDWADAMLAEEKARYG